MKDIHCIFCKQDSSNSKSVEHIVPESLGNILHALPTGVVCDSCNNYFALKVEKPVLDSEYFTHARFRNKLPNKKGRIPPLEIIYGPSLDIELGMYAELDGSRGLYPLDNASKTKFINYLQNHDRGNLYIPQPKPPSYWLVSRLLAKMALEILARRLMPRVGWEAEVTFKPELDELRRFARFGDKPRWPFYERRIYEEGKMWSEPDTPAYEILHEFDLLYTEHQELYAVIVILGVEYTINLGGPELEGYEKWLKEHDYKSPLYTGNNEDI